MPPPTIHDRIRVCKEHLDFSIRWKNERLGIVEMRRHYTNYFKGLPHFKDHRLHLVTTYDYAEIIRTLDEVEEKYANMELPPSSH